MKLRIFARPTTEQPEECPCCAMSLDAHHPTKPCIICWHTRPETAAKGEGR